MTELFDTEAKRNEAILHFESLKVNLGWQLVVKIVKENIAVLRKQLEDGVEGQTIEDINRLRDKIRDHQNFIDTPDMILEDFTTELPRVPESDPYE